MHLHRIAFFAATLGCALAYFESRDVYRAGYQAGLEARDKLFARELLDDWYEYDLEIRSPSAARGNQREADRERSKKQGSDDSKKKSNKSGDDGKKDREEDARRRKNSQDKGTKN